MLPNVRQATIRPVIEATVAEGALVHTDEYDVYARLEGWGYGHETVRHARRRSAIVARSRSQPTTPPGTGDHSA